MDSRLAFPLERNRYYHGRLLTAEDFETEQDYHRSSKRAENRLLHGAGVVCGLGVSMGKDETILVQSGVALDYDGNEIIVPEPVLRKLSMLEGYSSVRAGRNTWLCLRYDEKPSEKVAISRGNQSDIENGSQFNKIKEGFELFLSSQTPDYNTLFATITGENASVLYQDDDISVILCVPQVVRAGTEFLCDLYMVRNRGDDTVVFSLEGNSGIVETENEWLQLSYRQSPNEQRSVLRYSFKLKSSNLSGITDELFPQGAELSLEYGKRHYRNLIHITSPITVCRDREELERNPRQLGNLENHFSGSGLPIYLAKLELKEDEDGLRIEALTDLPFRQKIRGHNGADAESGKTLKVRAAARKLEYWRDPVVEADYYEDTETFSFDFALPTPDIHDYKVAHGVVDLDLPGGLRVNSRKVSEEVSHGLGPGNVEVRLAVEFLTDDGEQVVLEGNREVFRIKNFDLNVPWVETAVILYPERGTMRIGIWLHDTVPGNKVRVHYYAQKPEYDSDRMLAGKKPEIRIIPEICRVNRGEKLKMKASIIGSEDTSVVWKIKDADGGAIDANGVYEAPQTPGTYEIIATAGVDKDITANAFIIVE